MQASLDVPGLFAQGLAHHQAGHLDQAIACYRQVLALRPDLAPAHSNLATALCEQGKLEEAEAIYRQALALQPGQAELHNNLGTVLSEREKLDDAVSCYRRALALNPDYVEALGNLGAALHRQGKLDEAEASIRYALVLAPHFARALHILGALLVDQGRLDQAIVTYRQLLRSDPGDGDAMEGLAAAFAAEGDTALALEIICRSLQHRETASAKSLFAGIARNLRWANDDHQIRKMMVRALTEPWARPAELARSAARLVKQRAPIGEYIARAAKSWPHALPAPELWGSNGMARLAQDELLCTLLLSAPNSDVELERFLTMARRSLLDAATGNDADDSSLEFYAALARQCFINEYVFPHEAEEIQRVSNLRDTLTAALASGTSISNQHLLAVAAYFPLYSVSGAAGLLDRPWPESVGALLVQQLREPDEEAQLRAVIPQLTRIEDVVSRSVQTHYEENPYPRWVRIPRREKPITVSQYLRYKFPLAAFEETRGNGIADILSAGCGTGQLALELAQGVVCRLLAVDLSVRSLGYAARKVKELGLTGIEFAQADLLELNTIGRTFDVVESSGVLHHLADPFAGWRMLLSLLRPGGFMTLGLYSQIARRGVVNARQRIAQWGYGPSPEDIRRCRQDLLDVTKYPDPSIANSDDLFGVSSCRDLLFHGQEQRMELRAIAAFLRDHDLAFLGFETDQATLLAYRRRFPDDPAAINLRNWHIFEKENPDTFSGMYRFWIQKRTAHPGKVIARPRSHKQSVASDRWSVWRGRTFSQPPPISSKPLPPVTAYIYVIRHLSD